MRRLFTITALLTISISFGQNFSRCDIYQYKGTDSSQIYLNSTTFYSYNPKGQLVSKMYNNGADHYFYKDSLLIKIISLDEDRDTIETFHTYNKKGQRVKSEYSDFKKRSKKDNKGKGQSGGCLVTEDNYEKKKTWKRISEIYFKYDERGNKILEDATKLHWDRQNKYTWKYDDKNRIIEHRSYIVDKGYPEELCWIETFEYFNAGYNVTRTIYDNDGNPKHLKEKSWEYAPQNTFTYKTNSNGKIIEKIVTNEKGKMSSRYTTEYNEYNLISKTIYFDKDNISLETNIYKYTK